MCGYGRRCVAQSSRFLPREKTTTDIKCEYDCVDLTKLNESVMREKHDLPSVDQTLGRLAGSKVFTKLDANSGFWQIPQAPTSQELTTFITPFSLSDIAFDVCHLGSHQPTNTSIRGCTRSWMIFQECYA